MPALSGKHPPGRALGQDNGHAQAGTGPDDQAGRRRQRFSILERGSLAGRGDCTQRGGGEVVRQAQGRQSEAVREGGAVDGPGQVGQPRGAAVIGNRAGHRETAAADQRRIGLRLGKEAGQQAGEILKVGVGETAIENQLALLRQPQQRLGPAYISDQNHTATGAAICGCGS